MTKAQDQFVLRKVIIHVGGRVQGVGFRFSTYQKAQKLKLVGYVRNLISGEVEIVACGSKEDVDALIRWLDEGGPFSSEIATFHVKEMTALEDYTSFNVKY